jgi:hypothetical protein
MIAVDEKVCEERTKVLTKLVEKVDKHEDEIVDIKIIMERLTTLLEKVNKTLEGKQKFWETDNGKLLFTWLIRVSVGLISIAVGINILDLTGIIK